MSPAQFKGQDLQEKDDLLVAQLKRGQQSALKGIYDTHGKRIYALCFRLSGDKEIAEDICQEVFVQVWQKIHNFRGDSKFSTWLYSVASNVAISHLRKQKSWWRSWFGSAEQNEAELENIEVNDEQTNHDLSRSGLDKHIANLPEQARMVFVLFAVEGWRHEEIGKKLNIAVGSSKAQYHRAKQLLQQALNNEEAITGASR
ncbi:MAG: RNA polymerase sigma factor [Gammaproteobacteria bacterium]|nr:RNA polymerase sigma factor [Gammaproteobacteria bacterium]